MTTIITKENGEQFKNCTVQIPLATRNLAKEYQISMSKLLIKAIHKEAERLKREAEEV